MPVLDPMTAGIVAVIVVVALLLVWKFIKFAFKVAVIVGVAILIFVIADRLGLIGGV